jgi:putative ABC transport system substrate-binding protein
MEGRADCLLVGADGTVLAAVDALMLAVSDAGLPLIVSGAEYAEQGALIGIGPDFYDLGVASANIVIQILEGAAPADIPVVDAVTGGGLFVAINQEVADALGVTIPEGIDAEIVGGDAE